MIQSIVLFLFLDLLIINGQDIENANVCESIQHYNSPTLTCCAKKKYQPAGINFFGNDDAVKTCRENPDINASKTLVKKTWLMYKCILEKLMAIDPKTGEITLDNFADFMIKQKGFPDTVKNLIKEKIATIKSLLEKPPNPSRMRRSLRVKREDTGDEESEENENDPDDQSDSENDNGNQSEANPSTEPAVDNEIDEQTEKSMEEPETNEVVESNTQPPKENKEEDLNMEPTEAVTPLYIPVFDYLSAFEYSSSNFTHLIPDENMARIWDMYYVAEFEACQLEAGVSEDSIKEFGADRCFSWIINTARAGDCCKDAPIPTPLLNEPIIDRETIQNFTAQKLFAIPGTYTFTNLSYSSNIDRCHHLAVAILQKNFDLETLEKEVENYILSNATARPNYEKIVENLVAPFYPQELVDKIKKEVLPKISRKKETDKDAQGAGAQNGESDEKYYDIDTDISGDIEKISNTRVTMYKWAVVSEWDNLNVLKARYVMWNCDAYKIISRRIRHFDVESCIDSLDEMAKITTTKRP